MKKEITFIYSDKIEYQIYTPISKEAEKRGYSVKMSMNPLERCEIGFYCQHNNFPQFSKFSIIMLHDIIQGYGRWPDIWFNEPWNQYDLGFLPGNQWKNMWEASSKYFYARPKKKVYEVGWPKADILKDIDDDKIQLLKVKYGLNLSLKTVLYAPAWENDGKQAEFIEAVRDKKINILIKQFPWEEDISPEIYKNMMEMYTLYQEDTRIIQLLPSENILNAISVSDILVSEESSTMCEAVMLGIPAVSVSDWLIPDTVPSRYPSVDYNFVIKTTKNFLPDTIDKILNSYSSYKREAVEYSRNNFKNIGNTSPIIMDIVDSYMNNLMPEDTENLALSPAKKERLTLMNFIRFYWLRFKINIRFNYSVRFKLLNSVLDLYHYMKKR